MNNPLMILKNSHDRQIVIMILSMLDKKSVGEICDILDVTTLFINSASDIASDDDRIFDVGKIKGKILEGLTDDFYKHDAEGR